VRIRFGPFTLDSETRQLLRDTSEIRLSPKAFDLLCVLVERRPRVVDKAELHDRIWPGTFVVDANLNVLIGEIRRAVSDTPRQSRYIRTVHRIGFAFCAATAAEDAAATISPGPTRSWLVWNDRTFLLAVGENIIGRDPDCQIWLDASGVSRHHARIHIVSASADAWLDDLASTNGTLLRGAPVEGQEGLKDGDDIQIGSVTLTFRVWSADMPKKTDRIRRDHDA
jgi:DNA-binding winged helix-turn-helix (wHTH) protein